MPNHKATEKSLRQNVRRQKSNVSVKSKIRTLVKKVRTAVSEKRVEEVKDRLQTAVSALDTAAKRHIIHPRNAARRKSRLMRLVNSIEKN